MSPHPYAIEAMDDVKALDLRPPSRRIRVVPLNPGRIRPHPCPSVPGKPAKRDPERPVRSGVLPP